MGRGATPMTAPDPFSSGADAGVQPARWELRLYVAGRSPKSLRAIENLQRFCAEHLRDSYHIEVIDLIERPQLAHGDEIFAVPTLVRRRPEPIRRIIGDLSDASRVLVGLQLREQGVAT